MVRCRFASVSPSTLLVGSSCNGKILESGQQQGFVFSHQNDYTAILNKGTTEGKKLFLPSTKVRPFIHIRMCQVAKDKQREPSSFTAESKLNFLSAVRSGESRGNNCACCKIEINSTSVRRFWGSLEINFKTKTSKKYCWEIS